jgi:FKBP-type peptidyl-prolyl cis-trans isomerase
MKQLTSIASVIALACIATLGIADNAAPPAPAAPAAPAAPPAPPPVSSAEASYSFGVTFGEQLRRAGVAKDIAVDDIVRGLKDSLSGKAATPGDNQRISQFLRNARDAAGTRNKAAAKEFLAKNAKEPGVKSTASGLQYKVLTPGNDKAASPNPTDQVTVNYRGKLLDGTEFDSSYSRNEPATFPLNGVIKGWQEGLALMKPGAKWQLFIPPELAYDLRSPPAIPPGSLLVFDVELLSVKSAPPPKPSEKKKN